MSDPPPDVVGAIAEARADQAWATICDRIRSGIVTPEILEDVTDAADSEDPAFAFRVLNDECFGVVSLLVYAGLHYASARLMEQHGDSSE